MGCCCKKIQGKQNDISKDENNNDKIRENFIDNSSIKEETDLKNENEIRKEEGSELIGQKDKNLNIESLTVKKQMPYEIYLKDYLDENIDDSEVFNKNWYSDIEKDKIMYSKRSIIALIKKEYSPNNKDFKIIYDQSPLMISIKSNGSFITDQYQLTKIVYTSQKSEYPENTSLRMIAKYMLNANERNKWDKSIKSYKIIEGSEEGKEIKCIIHNWMKSPLFLVSERDIVEKRYDFFHEGILYSVESSVNDNYIPLNEDVTRINDIIFIQFLYEKDDEIIYNALTQINAKVSLPQAMINMTLSSKLLTFYKGVIEAINKDYNDGLLIFEDNDGNILENKNINNNIKDE
jgi:hypothetical protein